MNRFDLIIEAHEALTTKQGGEIEGVIVKKEEILGKKVTRVFVETAEAGRKIGKPMGAYTTIEIPNENPSILEELEENAKVIGNEIRAMMGDYKKGTVMVVGLGNREVTPDALGPNVADKIIVTRHLLKIMPEEFEDNFVSVCAVAPSVMGMTGIESYDIIEGIIKKVKPICLIVVDALSAGGVERLGNTFQICDSGITPGAGVSNKRKELSEKKLKIPVIAVGVPTIVDGGVLAASIMEKMGEQGVEKIKILQGGEGMMVTPKEIDSLIKNLTTVISTSINMAIQEGITVAEINSFLN